MIDSSKSPEYAEQCTDHSERGYRDADDICGIGRDNDVNVVQDYHLVGGAGNTITVGRCYHQGDTVFVRPLIGWCEDGPDGLSRMGCRLDDLRIGLLPDMFIGVVSDEMKIGGFGGGFCLGWVDDGEDDR